jgi:hypothetical protein
MKLGTKISLCAVAIAMVGVAGFVAACSSSGGSDTGSGSGSYTSTTPPNVSTSATAPTSTKEHNLALHKLYLGDVDPATDAKSADAWKNIGYDLDGKNTTGTSTDVCTRVAPAAPKIQTDGNGGIDNSFGENIIPLLTGFNVATQVNQAVAAGKFTVMIDTVGLPDSEPSDLSPLSAGLYIGRAFDPDAGVATPTFSPSDNWPVNGDFLSTPGDIKTPKVKFGSAYTAGGTWVSGSYGDVDISLSVSGITIDLDIHHAVLTFKDTVAGSAHSGKSGIIAGVLNATELQTAFGKVMGAFDQSLCSGPTHDSIVQQIAQSADIMDDGTNAAGATCTGISIGLGFTADEIGPPTVIGATPPASTDPCAATGGGGGGDDGGSADAAGE